MDLQPSAPTGWHVWVTGNGGYVAPTPGVGQPTPGTVGLQPQVTKNGVFAHWMHNAILMPTITAVSLLVLALLFWVVFRYRRAANPVPSKTSHNTVIEIIWTLAPVIILVLIAVPSIGLLSAQFKPDVTMIKKKIESLIEREYLERIEDAALPSYRYLA